jgi:GTP 3',8-cyclase
VRSSLAERFTLTRSTYRSRRPARYCHVQEAGGRVGFILPLTHSFCEACNRIRVTCSGKLYLCLGHEDGVDLREPLRLSQGDDILLAVVRAATCAHPRVVEQLRKGMMAPAREEGDARQNARRNGSPCVHRDPVAVTF